jgi:hypothetical protein
MEGGQKDMMVGGERNRGKRTLIGEAAVDADLMVKKGGEVRNDTVEVERTDTKMKSDIVLHPQNCLQAGFTFVLVVIVLKRSDA